MEMHFNLMWKLLGLVVTYFVGAKCESGDNLHFVMADLKVRDISARIDAYTRALDEMDAQIANNIKEITEVRIPEAAAAVDKAILKENNLYWTGATTISVGRTLRELSRNWQATSLTYPNIMQIVSGEFSAAAYAFGRLLRLRDRNLKCSVLDFYQVTRGRGNVDLLRMEHVYGFLRRAASPYFTVDPLKHLTVYTWPSVMKAKASRMGIDLKDRLACLVEPGLDVSSDLLRALDNLVASLSARLELTDKVLRLVVERTKISEPVTYFWYRRP